MILSGSAVQVKGLGLDPVEHYLRFGAREGRNPSRLFSTNEYLSICPVTLMSGRLELIHFCTLFGMERQRGV